MDNWLTSITTYLLSLVTAAFTALADLIKDAALWILDLLLSGISTVIASIPAPTFLTNNNIGTLLNPLPSFALYVIQNMQIGTAMTIIGAGVVFRLTRKFFTLGQW